MNFDDAFKTLIGHEGTFDANPKDRGNWTTGVCGEGMLRGTKYGISAMAYPALDIKNLTLEQAKEIYFRDYWTRIGAPQLPAPLIYPLFDMAVNSGPDAAIKALQRAVGASPDGVIGPQTMTLVAAMPAHKVVARFMGHRLNLMVGVPANTWREFGRGWAGRVADILIKV